MHQRDIAYDGITAGRYAKGLFNHLDPHDPKTLVDKLIIELTLKRSCERFAKLAPHLDEQLANFYTSLLRSSAPLSGLPTTCPVD